MTEMNKDHERRRFFRITDEVGLKFVVVDSTRESAPTVAQPIDPRRHQALLLEPQIRAAIDNLRVQSNPVAAVLALLNRKLNLVLDEKLPDTIEGQVRVMRSVSLSACGLAFTLNEPLPVGAELHMEMTLLPNHLRLALEGIVIGCSEYREEEGDFPMPADDQTTWLIRIDYKDIGEAEQEVLIQHVLACQSRELKARREARERSRDA